MNSYLQDLANYLQLALTALGGLSYTDWMLCVPLILVCIYFWMPGTASEAPPLALLVPLMAYVIYLCWHFAHREMGLVLVAAFGAVIAAGALFARRR
jgi:hypothetical protein